MVTLFDDDPTAVRCMVQYFYTLQYPNALVTNHSKRASKSILSDHSINVELGTSDLEQAIQNTSNGVENINLDEDETECKPLQGSAHDQPKSDVDLSVTTRKLPLSKLEQHLQVYVIADKYGIPLLKKKAAQRFKKEFANAELSLETINVIRGVYSMTIPQDRALRDIVIAQIWSEVQYWITDERFMEMARSESDFSADLLVHTVQEDTKEYEAALATIKHPG